MTCLDKSSIYNLKDQILELNLTIDDKASHDKFLKLTRDVFVFILVMFTKLTHLDFILSDNAMFRSGKFLSSASTIWSPSSIIHLNIRLYDFNDCLCLLDGRLSQLKTFIVRIEKIDGTTKIIDNTVGVFIKLHLSNFVLLMFQTLQFRKRAMNEEILIRSENVTEKRVL